MPIPKPFCTGGVFFDTSVSITTKSKVLSVRCEQNQCLHKYSDLKRQNNRTDPASLSVLVLLSCQTPSVDVYLLHPF